MKKVDRWAALTAALLLTVSLAPASQAAEAGEKIVILHTNDVHCALDDAIGYAGLAAYAGALEEQYGADRVTLVDAGDAVQGGPRRPLPDHRHVGPDSRFFNDQLSHVDAPFCLSQVSAGAEQTRSPEYFILALRP